MPVRKIFLSINCFLLIRAQDYSKDETLIFLKCLFEDYLLSIPLAFTFKIRVKNIICSICIFNNLKVKHPDTCEVSSTGKCMTNTIFGFYCTCSQYLIGYPWGCICFKEIGSYDIRHAPYIIMRLIMAVTLFRKLRI